MDGNAVGMLTEREMKNNNHASKKHKYTWIQTYQNERIEKSAR